MQKLFLVNKTNGGKEVQKVTDYIRSYNLGEKTFIEGTDILIDYICCASSRSNIYFSAHTSNKEDILLKVVENTLQGLTFEVVNIDINKSTVNILGENILYLKNATGCKIINLNTTEVIFELPKDHVYFKVLVSEGDVLVFEYFESIEGAGANSYLVKIQNDNLVSVSSNYDRISSYSSKGESFYTVKELCNGPEKIEYIEKGTGEIKSASSYDFIRMSDNHVNEGCLAIKDNNLYLIESPTKPAKLIRSFAKGQDVSFYFDSRHWKEMQVYIETYEDNFASVYTGTDVILVDFNGNIFAESIKVVHDPTLNVFSANPNRLVLFTAKDDTTWLYDIDTKIKTELKFEICSLGYESFDNFITDRDFMISTVSYLEKQDTCDLLKDFELDLEEYINEIELTLNNCDEEFEYKRMKARDLCEMIGSLEGLHDSKIAVGCKGDKITFYILEQGEFKPMFVEGDEVLYFDAFKIDEEEYINDKIVIDCVSANYDDSLKYFYTGVNVQNLIDNISMCKRIELSKDGFVFTDRSLSDFVSSCKEALEYEAVSMLDYVACQD